MTDVYDKERTAALIEEARQITADLKVEAESIKKQMDRVLEGGEDEFVDLAADEKVGLEETRVPKSVWRFWR